MFQQLESIINNNITLFISEVSKKYNINQGELDTIYRNIVYSKQENKVENKVEEKEKFFNLKSISEALPKQEAKAEAKPDIKPEASCAKKARSKVVTNGKLCIYVFKSGKNIGSACGAGATEGEFCNRHKALKNKGEKVSPAVKVQMVDDKHVLRAITVKDGTKCFIHEPTGFIFNTEESVIGKMVTDKHGEKEIKHGLVRADTDLCMKYGFSYSCPIEKEGNNDMNEEGELSESDITQ